MQPGFLQPGEQPLRIDGRHPLSALDAWLGIAFLLLLVAGPAVGLAWVAAPHLLPYAVAGAAVLAVLAALWALAVWFRVRTSVNVVTAERVYHAHGQLRFFLSQTTYDRVTDLHVHQSFFGRRLGFGTVLVQTAGQGVVLEGVRDPLGAKRAIEEAREAMVRSLVASHRPARQPVGTATPPAQAGLAPAFRLPARMGGPPVWKGGPTLASFLARLLPLLLVVPFGLVPMLGAMSALGRAGLILPALLVVAVGAIVANTVIRLRTTHYEVHTWGVAVASGWLGRSRVEARYEKVTDVAVTQDVLGRLFGYGTIRINTAGGAEAPITFAGIRAPDQVKALVDRARLGPA